MGAKLYDNRIELTGIKPCVYPFHVNRKGDKYTVSRRYVLEIAEQLGYTIDTAPPALRDAMLQERRARLAIERLMSIGPTGSPVVNEHLTLRPIQEVAREIAWYRDKYCIYLDTRVGKTPTSLAIINDDLKKNPKHKWLIICPLTLIENAWIPDMKKFVPGISYINCHATTKARRLEKLKDKSASIYITNTESFASYKEYFDLFNFDGIILDESSCLKSPKTKQTKAILEAAWNVKRFYQLSGRPAPNCEVEYYSQIRAVDYYGVHQSLTRFKQEYFVDTSFNSNFEKLMLRPDKKDDLFNLIKKYAIYADMSDELNLPGREFIEVPVEMPKRLAEHYRAIKNKMATEVSDDVTITTLTAGAKINKLRQVTAGFLIDTDAKKENAIFGTGLQEVYNIDDYKLKKLSELLEKHKDEQVIIWAFYHEEFRAIKELLGDKCRCVYGLTSASEKTQYIQEFKNGKVQYLVANAASASKGLTLTNCHICIYLSLDFSYENYYQSIQRIYGDISSQPKFCTYYFILAKGTIDEDIYRDTLQGKGAVSMTLLNHLKRSGV